MAAKNIEFGRKELSEKKMWNPQFGTLKGNVYYFLYK